MPDSPDALPLSALALVSMGLCQPQAFRVRAVCVRRLMSPARKREMPLSEMSQLYRHLTLPHTFLEI
jgi:hypothetical protein